MVSSVAIATSSPYPPPKARWMVVAAMPKIVVDNIPVTGIELPTLNGPFLKEEEPQELKPLDDKTEVQPIDAVAEAKAYLAKTAYPGGSISVLGRKKSVACFNPQFALNLAAAIRDARAQGLTDAAVFSGCRPPRLGIGGFKDKRNSLHGVGLAADIHGIGAPCSAEARQFHRIAASHGVFGAYGPCNRAEWNHMQGTQIKMTTPALRTTFTPGGDITPDLQSLWAVESSVVLAVATPVDPPVISAESRSGERTRAKRHPKGKHRRTAKRHDGHRTAGRHGSKHVARADR
jgi:hypothetical protein